MNREERIKAYFLKYPNGEYEEVAQNGRWVYCMWSNRSFRERSFDLTNNVIVFDYFCVKRFGIIRIGFMNIITCK